MILYQYITQLYQEAKNILTHLSASDHYKLGFLAPKYQLKTSLIWHLDSVGIAKPKNIFRSAIKSFHQINKKFKSSLWLTNWVIEWANKWVSEWVSEWLADLLSYLLTPSNKYNSIKAGAKGLISLLGPITYLFC